jgi:hypothetical protein
LAEVGQPKHPIINQEVVNTSARTEVNQNSQNKLENPYE